MLYALNIMPIERNNPRRLSQVLYRLSQQDLPKEMEEKQDQVSLTNLASNTINRTPRRSLLPDHSG